MKSELSLFKKNGFINLGQILPEADVDELAKLCKNLYLNFDKNSQSFFEGSMDGCNDLLNHNPDIAPFLSDIISNIKISQYLDAVLGEEFKILDIAFRRSKPGDKGLYLHQDGVGQVNMVIGLDDNPMADGATAFLAGSHLIEKSIQNLKLELPAVLLNLFRVIFTPLKCKKGDVCFFSNRVWHGRFSNKSRITHDILLVGFFPRGYSYYSKSWPDSTIQSIAPMPLANFLGSHADYANSISSSSCESRENGKFYVNKKHAYSMDIENHKYLSQFKKSFKLVFSISLIFLLIRISRYPYKALKYLMLKNGMAHK